MQYQIFISHASIDKENIVLPLKDILIKKGVNVWIDQDFVKVGDKPLQKIDQALAKSEYAVVVFSNAYFKSRYALGELNSIISLGLPIIGILNGMSYEELQKLSPNAATYMQRDIGVGISNIAMEIVSVLANSAVNNNSDTTVIGISGASCSGKTWLAEKIKAESTLPVTMFDLDSFYKPKAQVDTLDHNYDNPNAIDYIEAATCLAQLVSGQPTEVPIYNFETHKQEGAKVLQPNPLIIFEGLFSFSIPNFRSKMDLKIWVQSTDDLMYERRLKRDVNERGREYGAVMEQYARDVKPGYQRFIHPLKFEADIIFQNNGRLFEIKPKIVDLVLSYLDKRQVAKTI